VNNYWWPIAVMGVIIAAVTILAFYLCGKRDLGGGLLPARPGRKTASPMLSGAGGLALRLLRTSIIIWAATVFILAAAYGSIFGDIEGFLSNNELLSAMVSADSDLSYTEQFVTMLMVIMSIISTIPVLSFALRARSQEKYGYAENVLTRAVSQGRQLGVYSAIAFASSFVMQLLTALGFWSASSMVMDDPIPLGTFFEAAFAYLPAIWVMLGITLLLIAYLPGKTSLAWLYLGYSFFAVYLGALIDLPDWAKKISPYGSIPQIPVEEMDYRSMIVLTAIAAVMVVIGFAGYRRRDMKYL